MRRFFGLSARQLLSGTALLAIFAVSMPNDARGQLLYSFESGLEGWVQDAAMSIAQSNIGATQGTQSLAVEVGPNFTNGAMVSADATVFNAIAATAGTGKLYDIRTDLTFTPESWDNLSSPGSYFGAFMASNSSGGFLFNQLASPAPGGTGKFTSHTPLLKVFPNPADLQFAQIWIGKNGDHANGTQGVTYFVDNVRIQEITETQLFSWEGNAEGWEDGFTGHTPHQRSFVTDYGVTSGTTAMQFISPSSGFSWGSRILLNTPAEDAQRETLKAAINQGDALRFDVTTHPDQFSVVGVAPPSYLNLTLSIQDGDPGYIFYQSFDMPINLTPNTTTTVTIPFEAFRAGGNNLATVGLQASNFLQIALATNAPGPTVFAIDNFRVIQAALPGDYNKNGVVDTADYVVWRNSIGPNMMPNDPTPGTVDDSDYTFWRSQFGATPPSGSAAGFAATVPEPATLPLALVVLLGGLAARARGKR